MKKLIAALIFALTVGSAMAQTATEKQSATTKVITGAVIDKNGNPLPGAIVSATGGAETVTADADGTFTIEVPVWLKSLTASYPGLGEKKMKTNALNQMIFTLKSRNRTHGFINLVGQLRTHSSSEFKIPTQGEFGIMGGAYRSWGGYVKLVIRCVGNGYKNVHNNNYEYHYDALPTTSFGVIKRITPTFNLFLGGVVGFNYGYYEEQYYYTEPYYNSTFTGGAEFGAMWKFCNKLNTTLGLQYLAPTGDVEQSGIGVFLGIGLNL